MLSREQARRFYDAFGARQDRQTWYEDPALERLVEHADFESARSVFELGCGTGRFAEGLLAERLPAAATYVARDLSPKMVELARGRLARFGDRVDVAVTGGELPLDRAAGTFDRFVSNYVLDLLPDSEVDAVLAEAARLLRAGGRLALTGLTHGPTPLSRVVSTAWTVVQRLRPSAVGGCRPQLLGPRLGDDWRVLHSSRVVARGVPSEVLVAARRG